MGVETAQAIVVFQFKPRAPDNYTVITLADDEQRQQSAGNWWLLYTQPPLFGGKWLNQSK